MWSDLDKSDKKTEIKGAGKLKRIVTTFPGVFFLVFGVAAVIGLGVVIWGFMNPPDLPQQTREKWPYMWNGGTFLAIRNVTYVAWQDIQVSMNYEESTQFFTSSAKGLEPHKLTSLRYTSFKDNNGNVFPRDQSGYIEVTITATTPTGEEIKLTGELWLDQAE